MVSLFDVEADRSAVEVETGARRRKIGISAIGRWDLVVAGAAWIPPPPLCCGSMFRFVTAGRG